MIAFVNAWALLGMLAIAIPLAIHLLRSKRRVTQVPSILLFTNFKKPSPRRKIEKLILLILRCAGVIILALILSRPYMETKKSSLSTADGSDTILAVVLDDSAASAVSIDGTNAFEIFKRQAIRRISELTQGSIVFIANSTSKAVSQEMSPDDAAALIRKMKLQPAAGDLAAAADAAWDAMISRNDIRLGAMLVEALPFERVWSGFNAEKIGLKQKAVNIEIPADFYDKLDPYITGSGGIGENSELTLLIEGTAAALAVSSVKTECPDGSNTKTAPVPPSASVSKTIKIPMIDTDIADGMKLSLLVSGKETDSPLADWYLSPGGETSSSDSIVILHDGSELSRTAVLALHAALQTASGSKTTVKVINTASGAPSQINSRPSCIIVPPMKSLDSEWMSWIGKSLSEGSNVMVFPDSPKAFSGIDTQYLPVWQGMRKVKNGENIAVGNNPSLPRGYFLLYGKGLSKISLAEINPPETTTGDLSVFSCGEKPLLCVRPVQGGGNIMMWGTILNPLPLSLVLNPLFPQLISDLCMFGKNASSANGLFCGTSVDAASILSLKRGNATMSTPEGKTENLSWLPSRPAEIFMPSPGFYDFRIEMKEKTMREVKAANMPRQLGDILTKELLAETAGSGVNIITFTDPARMSELEPAGVKNSDRDSIMARKDLIPAAAMLLAFCLSLEMLFAAFSNRRRESVR